jgi:nucleoside-diphosphate-sugar epimerase
MRVLVTGHRGYIGSVMVTVLRNARYDVVGLDCDFYRGCDFGRVRESVPAFEIDLREIEFTDLLSFDAVIHLAAVPVGISPELDVAAREINEEAAVRLAECCRQAGVARFLFASCCSVYGRGLNRPFDEESPANPTTPHAVVKYRCERAISELADHSFAPVFLRHASVYGVSPRLRTDLPVNGMVASAVATGRAALGGRAAAWRPLVHVEDLCRAYAAMLTAPDDVVRNQVFNIAAQEENYRVIDIADMVTELDPHYTRSVAHDANAEPSLRVDGTKLRRTFPKLSFRWTLPLGLRQLRTAMLGAGFTPGDWRSDRYRRAMRLKSLIEQGRLDPSLRALETAAC